MQISELTRHLDELLARGTEYLHSLEPSARPDEVVTWRSHHSVYWDVVPPGSQQQAEILEREFLPIAKAAVETCKRSALVDQADIRDLQVAVKSIRSALHLRRYVYSDGEAIHDEGTVLGFSPPSQEERPLSPSDAPSVIRYSIATIRRILDLARP
jgi:hypothetical protein